ncbi:hypothetical protein F0P96_04955 [Hymenobacter busanensis]|uniref:Uncharacterized protein n=1 Tax=Hymenobacter busanensis TaxID=2607656 RepID=A0A7L5A1I2_9BACT|nr:hypothetical protein [Hymenobacter busanensis]KAA9338197.1 hypothetical protein F0P96_04955 [Hymenobacter busanensis]QHJ09378.1 hypothetical protein GUY19_19655 [Hymenobacter busanensis]
MIHRLLFLLLLTLAAPALRAQPATAWTDHTRALPDKLRRVPVGLTLWHTPNPNHPEPDPAQPGHYVWKHSTMVRADVADLEIVECGSIIWYSAEGWQANMRETPAEFAELFNCPDGRLRQGVTYTFAKNYRRASSARQLYGGDALWYILARDRNGKLYKGMGLIETEADVLDTPAATTTR